MKQLLAFLALSALPLSAHAAALTPQIMSMNGIAPTYNAANSGGDTFLNDGRTYVHIKNGSGGSLTVTFASVASYTDNALGTITLSNLAVAVPAGAERIVGFFPLARFNDVNGRVSMTYSGVTSLTVAVVRAGKAYQ
ncbi:hypothetical protein [Phenylobacterium sp.]|uniref:hypothetical protein n=1 Tax=Phenylobacterium sp. TaxID=1871053 RepID=UPI00301CF031